ncbi:MAG: Cell wall-associated hydrolase, NlpC family [Pseudonocardiales bacterium]|nr:Cell wall-associated hydrolase, NlpC family [Pseudonocardiales bacterium]
MPVSRHLRPACRPRAVAALAVLISVAALLVAPGGAVAKPPPNPSNGQLSAAQRQKNALATEVGQLSGQVAQMQSRLLQLKVQQDLAEQKLAYALSKLTEAKTAADKAQSNLEAARREVVKAQQDFVGYVQASYMSGDVSGTTGTLLTANDPNVLLEQGTLQNYQANHQLNAIGNMQRASVALSNADAAARQAVKLRTDAKNAADAAKQQAIAALTSAREQQRQLQATLAVNQHQLAAAQEKLATLNNQRNVYLAFVAEQARIAHERWLAEQRRKAEAAAAAAARARQIANAGSGGGGGGGGGVFSPAPPPSGGSWSGPRGQTAASRALQWLGATYIWAGGNASGPTDGGCSDPIAPCGTVGFDCSGLVLYAWGPYLGMSHLASAQFTEAGSYHPPAGAFQPGDLLFWSGDGTIGGIHHVAIYIGGGNVVQAPQSGDIVRITPWDQVESDYFGATRPLT